MPRRIPENCTNVMTNRWIGIDGSPAGWIAAAVGEGNAASIHLYTSITAVWASLEPSDRVLIDIPIGFAVDENGVRECDRLARRHLGNPRSSSVFPCPTREALEAETYQEACAVNERLIGKRLTKQSWGIAPKIREVDALLRANIAARERIQEVHPEVLFWALNGRRPMKHRKGKSAGLAERLAVLQRFLPDVQNVYLDALDRFPRSQVARDDVLDALAAAITGRFGGDVLQILPHEPPADTHGLRTEIRYWVPAEFGDGR